VDTVVEWAKRRERWIVPSLAAVIILLGALLRADAFVGRYGQQPRPAWTHVIDTAARAGGALRPHAVKYTPVAVPYVGGDPINYLRFAREMTNFYQAHVREPVYLALGKLWLWIFSDADVGLSAASACASILVILATLLLGRAYGSSAVGLAAGLLMAIELDAIWWGVGGWRDDTFALFVTLTAWQLVRLQQRPTNGRAVLAGVMGAAACLTRITSITFLVPSLAWILVEADRRDRNRVAGAVGVAALVTAILIAPYLIACAREFGDPLYAVNYHTRYYRAAEGLQKDESVTAASYVRSKLVTHPVASIDTLCGGIFTFPMSNKWRSYNAWIPGMGPCLLWLAAAGTVAALLRPDGRLLLVLLFSSLIPYALTWTVGGGREWRFTEHAYPIYLVLACDLVRRIAIAVRLWIDSPLSRRAWLRTFSWPAAVLASALLVILPLHIVIPFFVARESLQAGEIAMIAAGPRDTVFFNGGWSAPSGKGVMLRAAERDRVRLRVPLPATGPLLLTLRMDPAETRDPARQPAVTVFLNRQLLGTVALTRTPGRVGTYRFTVPAGSARGVVNNIEFVSTHTVPAADAGVNFASLDATTPVAFRLWYARIEPLRQ
jgi:4-amino-4-deoxy-L-arabinose transferase-like glycosyltransferase